MAVRLPLTGKTIVVTRPERQLAGISQRLDGLGAAVIEYSLIAIEAPADKHVSLAKLKTLGTYDYLIFTSRNAVEMAFKILAEALTEKPLLDLFAATNIAAVGKQTAEALAQAGVVVSIVPDALFNSEALLDNEALKQVKFKRIAIIRGESGRDLLRETLVQRGASVEYIDVYRRICPVSDLLPLVKCQQQIGIDIILLTSVEGLTNLFTLGADQDWLKQTALLVGSQRMADVVNSIDHNGRVIVADDPSDDKMISCLLNWVAAVDN